jgi:transposase
LAYGFGLQASCGDLYRALARLARRAAPTYKGLVEATRQDAVNVPDETGWKVGGHPQWMHVTVSAQVTVSAILPGRGYEQSEVLLGAAYAGFLVHDGWAPYYGFRAAFHQSCLRHLLTRCQEMARRASPAAATFPLAVKAVLQSSLQLRDRYREGEISEPGFRSATGCLEARLDRLLDKSYRHRENRRLAKHLQHERPHLFTFLYCPGLDATNHEAERAIRWMW